MKMTSKRTHVWLATSAVAIASTLYVLLACAATPQDTTAAPTPAAACAKDTDCKGDRICEKGTCVSPE